MLTGLWLEFGSLVTQRKLRAFWLKMKQNCPITQKKCEKGKCAFWVVAAECCAIPMMAIALAESLNLEMVNLEKETSHGRRISRDRPGC